MSITEKNLALMADTYPQALWEMFARLSGIPRQSKNEAGVTELICNLVGNNFKFVRDKLGNVVVYLPATAPEFNDRLSICLQSHIDMVCEKLKGSTHDFTKDSIQFVRSGDKLTANGTTLGADNGIGAAAMLALIADYGVVSHGPLELLFTVMEEIGFEGAAAVDPTLISSRLIINLDSEEEGEIFVGCAGGGRVNVKLGISHVESAPKMTKARLSVSKLLGGHSGLEIHLGHGNAIKLLGRMLQSLWHATGVRVISVKGGDKMNAIPREAEAEIMYPVEESERFHRSFQTFADIFRSEYKPLEPELSFTLEHMEPIGQEHVMDYYSQRRLLQLIAVLPHGVIRLDPNNPALVETSNNVAILAQSSGLVTVTAMFRSSVESQMDCAQECITSAAELAGGRFEILNRYPAWEPRLDTDLLASARAAYQKLFGRVPTVKTVHAGLECAVFSRMLPDAQIISFGPTMKGVHTPDEYVDIPSVGKFWNFLQEVIGV